MNHFAGQSEHYEATADCGGFTWRYLDSGSVPDGYDLIEYFNLNKWQRDSFRKQE